MTQEDRDLERLRIENATLKDERDHYKKRVADLQSDKESLVHVVTGVFSTFRVGGTSAEPILENLPQPLLDIAGDILIPMIDRPDANEQITTSLLTFFEELGKVAIKES